MHYELEVFRAISASERQRLAGIGIHNTDDLLRQGARPHLRQQLSVKTTIPTADLIRWVGMADLVRIKGIGPAFAEILVESGKAGNIQQFLRALGVDEPYRDVVPTTGRVSLAERINALALRLAAKASHLWRAKKVLPIRPDLIEHKRVENVSQSQERFAQRTGVRSSAEDLAKELRVFAAASRISRRSPSTRELAEAAEEAVELRPRVVLAERSGDDAFRESVRREAHPQTRAILKYALSGLGILAATMSLLVLGLCAWKTMNYRLRFTNGSDLEALIGDLWSTAIRSLGASAGLLVGVALAVILVMILAYEALSRVQETWLVYKLFNTPERQSFYQEVQKLGLEPELRGSRRALYIFAVLALGAVLLVIVAEAGSPSSSASAALGPVSLLTTAAGTLIVGAIALPSVKFYWQELRQSPTVTEDSFRTYLIYLLSKMVWIPIMILLMSQLGWPRILEFHRLIYQRYILPDMETDLTTTRSAILDLPIEDQAAQEQRMQLLEEFDEAVTEQLTVFGVISPQDTDPFDLTVPMARYSVFWLVLAAVVLLFAVPYFVLWDWKRASFYLVLVLTASWVEDKLRMGAPAWFSLNAESIPARVIVLMVVFLVALFFDWLYERLAERKRTCPGCMKPIDENAMFCPNCGLTRE